MTTCNILVKRGTRDKLKNLRIKAKTYDDLINELMERRVDIIDGSSILFGDPGERLHNKKVLVGQRFDPLAQQASGGQ